MRQLRREIEAHFEAFTTRWKSESQTIVNSLDQFSARFLASYSRLVSMQSWRTMVLEPAVSSKSLAFFLEAQNDALVSHVMARLGSWRVALQALRTCMENTASCLYYMDHPVELEQWEAGSHRLTFRELLEYFRTHPRLAGVSKRDNGLEVLGNEYGTLSRAVHASAAGFRMAAAGSTLLWTADQAKLGQWSTREGRVLLGINLLLVSFFRRNLESARLRNLRKAISFAIPTPRHAGIKARLHVTLFTE
jgi:hypothetical protein